MTPQNWLYLRKTLTDFKFVGIKRRHIVSVEGMENFETIAPPVQKLLKQKRDGKLPLPPLPPPPGVAGHEHWKGRTNSALPSCFSWIIQERRRTAPPNFQHPPTIQLHVLCEHFYLSTPNFRSPDQVNVETCVKIGRVSRLNASYSVNIGQIDLIFAESGFRGPLFMVPNGPLVPLHSRIYRLPGLPYITVTSKGQLQFWHQDKI